MHRFLEPQEMQPVVVDEMLNANVIFISIRINNADIRLFSRESCINFELYFKGIVISMFRPNLVTFSKI